MIRVDEFQKKSKKIKKVIYIKTLFIIHGSEYAEVIDP